MNRNQGFVLLEILLTVVILSGSLVLIIQSMTATLKAARETQNYMTALFLAEDKLNDLIQKKKIPVDLTESKEFPEPNDKYSYILTTKRMDFIEIPEDLDPYVDKINEVNLQLSWLRGQKVKTFHVVTYLFDQK